MDKDVHLCDEPIDGVFMIIAVTAAFLSMLVVAAFANAGQP